MRIERRGVADTNRRRAWIGQAAKFLLMAYVIEQDRNTNVRKCNFFLDIRAAYLYI